MQIDGHHGGSVADQDLNAQTIAIAHTAHRLNVEIRKTVVSAQVFKGRLGWTPAPGKQRP
jgi:hypothetical protein